MRLDPWLKTLRFFLRNVNSRRIFVPRAWGTDRLRNGQMWRAREKRPGPQGIR